MRSRIRKWGNSASVRIPASLLAAASLSLDQAIELREENGRILIEPVPEGAVSLNDLLDAMTPDTFPDEIGFGPPVGGEAW